MKLLALSRLTLSSSRPAWPLPVVVLALSLTIGIALRLVWIGDIEYKFDERDYFEQSQRFAAEGTWPMLGPPSSQELRAPGGGYWVFIALTKIGGIDTPTGLARACQLLNILALIGFVAFVWKYVPLNERETWQWGLSLASVNPLLVLFQRKIWNCSVTPIFLLVALWGWWHRDRRLGAFLWGLVGVAIGQLHVAGLFLAAGFAAWAMLFDRRNVRWRWWALGSTLGTATLIPWLTYLAGEMGQQAVSSRKWGNLFTLQFWNRWVTEPLGISLHYSLGDDFMEFLSGPTLFGIPTYLVALLHIAMLVFGIAILLRATISGWRQRSEWKTKLFGNTSPTSFTIMAGLVGFGIVLTATKLPIPRHYMLLAFPLPCLWLASIGLVDGSRCGFSAITGRRLLAGLIVCQAMISLAFLNYVHNIQRPIHGDYGTPYRAQVELGLPEK